MSTLFSVQYLEDGPGVRDIPPAAARAKLRGAAERLPISMVLVGWNLPPALRDACGEEARRIGARFYRWHPLLTGDGVFTPRREWRCVGLSGQAVSGFRDLPEFTFVCPNRPAVRDAVGTHLSGALAGGVYDGVFLDRIRFPSPLADPESLLACFCEDCVRAAADDRLDLMLLRDEIRLRIENPRQVACALLGEESEPFSKLLEFRSRSITRMVDGAASVARQRGLSVGLDCFSPALTRACGQDLAALNQHCDWIKVMTYAHALGPAGLPFEFCALVDWLVRRSVAEGQALACLAEAAGLPLPASREQLRTPGLGSDALGAEVRRARAAGVSTLLAGIELVKLEGVTHLEPDQIRADARAMIAAGADGLALSWDLWHIPDEFLELVA